MYLPRRSQGLSRPSLPPRALVSDAPFSPVRRAAARRQEVLRAQLPPRPRRVRTAAVAIFVLVAAPVELEPVEARALALALATLYRSTRAAVQLPAAVPVEPSRGPSCAPVRRAAKSRACAVPAAAVPVAAVPSTITLPFSPGPVVAPHLRPAALALTLAGPFRKTLQQLVGVLPVCNWYTRAFRR
jgi:hypothetical protein